MKTISHTAQWTAAARAIESDRTDAIFHDPLARTMAYPEGFNLLDKFGGGGLIEFVAIRTKFIDQCIKDCVNNKNIKQVVMLAAGMDTRAYRLDWPQDCTLYELDYEALHQEKQRRLNACKVSPNVTRKTVYTDLNEDWLQPLQQSGFKTTLPTLWVIEALLFFLTEEQVRLLLKSITLLSTQGSIMATDILSAQLLQNSSTQLFLKKLQQYQIPWLFGTDHPENFLLQNGWQVTLLKQPGEDGAHWDRWPYPVHPQSAQGIPRNWLIQAELAPK